MRSEYFLKDFLHEYELHQLWLQGKPEGQRMNISYIDFSYWDLSNLNLQGAILQYNRFRGVDFRNANLSIADLSHSIIYGADLRYAILYGAKLYDIDFYGSDLRYADLRKAEIGASNFRFANTNNTKDENIKWNVFVKGTQPVCPEEGSFIAFKRAQGYILKLEIPEDALRSSGFTRKCRASKVRVLEITHPDGSPTIVTKVHSDFDKDFPYELGEISEVENFDTNRWHEHGQGIYFYISREEALYG